MEAAHLTWAELDRRALTVAGALRGRCAAGDRALLLLPSGPDFIAAFFGCLYAGVVAVPAYPPHPRRDQPLLRSIGRDATPRAVLTTAGLLSTARRSADPVPELAGAAWLAVDDLPDRHVDPGGWPEPRPGAPAFLQYTSGSTSCPRGVVVTHANLLHNQRMICDAFGQHEGSVVVGWLPLHHDMGLIGNVLQPLHCGGRCVLMSPAAFLQRPRRWLEAIGRYRATTSGGPNFAYDLCVRRIGPDERAGLDLSSWQVAFNGAEPVLAETLERFADAFGPCGFRREAAYPCYGLAEATLLVSGGIRGVLPRVETMDGAALERHAAVLAQPGCAGARRLVSCGRPWLGQRIAIADPSTGAECPPGRIGEIWVSGPSVAGGYWARPEETESGFRAKLAGGGPERFLRTGDLGFVAGGELFITGRLKDLVILHGRNHYPQDLERTAESSHPALRPGGGAAFALEVEGEERLVVVHEVDRLPAAGVEEVVHALRRALAQEHEAQVHEVVLIRKGTLPKTTSGKVRRGACRDLYRRGVLAEVGRSAPEGGAARAVPTGPAGRGALRETLLAATEEERPALAEAFLRRTLARLAGVDPAVVDPAEPLSAYGLDSLAMAELRDTLETGLGASPSIAALLEGAPLREVMRRALALARAGPPASDSDLASAESGEPPLSWEQESLFFLHRLAPESAAYHLAAAVRLPQDMDPGTLLDEALQQLVDRHAALRTTFALGPDGPVQQVHDRWAVSFHREEAAGWSEEEVGRRLHELAFQPFDLERGPVFRASLLKRGGESLLVLAVHHIAADLGSFAVLARELGALYAGKPLPPVAAGLYAEHARRQHRMLSDPHGERLWRYWQGQLAGAPPLVLPCDRPRPPVQTFRGAARAIRLGSGLAAELRALARHRGCTRLMVLLAGFQALLARTSGQHDFLVGTPTSGRTSARLSGVVGCLVNPVALRADLAGDPSGEQWLERVRTTALGAFEHRDFPLALLAERLRPQRDPGRPPLVQAMLELQAVAEPELAALAAFALGQGGARLDLSGLILESVALASPAAQLDLTLTVAELGGDLVASLRFNTDLFDATTAARMLGHFAEVLAGLATAPGRRVSELPLLTGPERAQLLREWNDTAAGIPAECCHRPFELQAARAPGAPAVAFEGQRLSYGELDALAGRLARYLRSLGVGPGTLVGVAMERSLELPVAVLGVLKAGGAYLPLDPAYPVERLGFMLSDSRVAVLLSQVQVAGSLPPHGARVVLLDTGWEVGAEAGGGLDGGAGPDDLAYVIYTSGSTGRPKGVEVTHRALANLLAAMGREPGLAPDDALLAVTSLSFDIAALELFLPLLTGACLEMVPSAVAVDGERLLDRLASSGATALQATPSTWRMLLEAGWREPGRLRLALSGGEALPGDLAGRLRRRVARLWNVYGPTETTVWSTAFRIDEEGPATVPIGRPIANTCCYLLGRWLEPVPVGAPGELWIGGAGVARGYLGRPDSTAERFVPDPFGGTAGGRLYHTGDLVRSRRDGVLEFLGRADHQVKIRGYRVELEEIEAVLRRHPQVGSAAVAVRNLGGDPRLVAYVVPAGEHRPAAAALRTFLRQALPEPMVPSAFVTLNALPLTPNRKVDRRALPEPDGSEETGGDSSAPRTAVEELLAATWADLLGLRRVGVHDDFFELGGHSLLATRGVSRLRRLLRVELPLATWFQHPTVSRLAAEVERVRRSTTTRAAPPLTPAHRSGPLPLSFAQERHWFFHRLDPCSAVFHLGGAVRLSGRLRVEALAASLEEIVRRHEALRTAFREIEGEPVQVVAAPGPLPLPLVDLSGLRPAEGERELALLAGEAADRPFSLASEPLLRALLVRLAGDEHTALLTLHHIAGDGWSLEILLRELGELYTAFAEGCPSPLPELPVQYADFAVWQRRWLSGAVLEEQLAYWRRRLGGKLPVLELPMQRQRPALPAFRGGRERIAVAKELGRALDRLGRREGSTLFMTLLAAFKTLLYLYTRHEDLVVGTTVANRTRSEIEGLIGCFVNNLALRTDLSGNPSFRELLGRVREVALEAYDHQDVPLERVVEDLQPQRHGGYAPLFRAMFVLHRFPATARDLPGLRLVPLDLRRERASFDLMLTLTETEEGLEGSFLYDADLLDGATVARMAEHFAALLERVVADPDQRLADIPLAREAEARRLAGAFSQDF